MKMGNRGRVTVRCYVVGGVVSVGHCGGAQVSLLDRLC